MSTPVRLIASLRSCHDRERAYTRLADHDIDALALKAAGQTTRPGSRSKVWTRTSLRVGRSMEIDRLSVGVWPSRPALSATARSGSFRPHPARKSRPVGGQRRCSHPHIRGASRLPVCLRCPVPQVFSDNVVPPIRVFSRMIGRLDLVASVAAARATRSSVAGQRQRLGRRFALHSHGFRNRRREPRTVGAGAAGGVAVGGCRRRPRSTRWPGLPALPLG